MCRGPSKIEKAKLSLHNEKGSFRTLEIIAGTIDKQLRFVDESPEESRARRQREGCPLKIIESYLVISAYPRAGAKDFCDQKANRTPAK